MELHFRTLGDGPPFIILHGLLGSLDNWLPLGRKFAERFKVFAVDQRNHGSSPHSEEFGYDVMSHDLHQFMGAHDLTRAHLLGHSMGGKTAMHFALLHPGAVDKLIVVDMAPRAYPPSHAETFAALRALDLKACHQRDELDAALAASVPEIELRRFLLKNLARTAGGSFRWKANLSALWENHHRLNEALPTNRQFAGPTLFVRGGASDYIRDSDYDLVRQLFPRAEMRTIPKAGHWVHADAPEDFARIVLEFLTTA